jgi:hypothetical protein
MTDNILGKPKSEENKYKPTRKPVLLDFAEYISNLDPELRKLRHVMVRPTQDNREYAFWNDSISQSFSYITAYTIIGDGLRIRSNNKRAEKLIKDFNEEINVRHQHIEDFIVSSWIDEIVHANSYWRHEFNKDYNCGVDIQRLDPKSIVKVRDPKYGWTKLIQKVGIYKSHRSKAAFYSKASKDDMKIATYPYHTREVHIPDEPIRLTRTNFFYRPPIGSALHYITYKRWILYFMRKYSQKYWAPFLLFFVGDTKSNYYPDTPNEMQTAIDDIADIIPEMSNWGGAALPGNVQVEELGKGSSRSSEIYVTYMNALDKQIMMSIFASMGLREASGTELATQRGLREGFLTFLRGMRRKYARTLDRFYSKCLCPVNGIHVSPSDIEIEWNPLKFEPSEEMMNAINLGVKTGMFVDRNEVRRAGSQIWKWLDPIDKDEMIDFEIIKTPQMMLQNNQSSTADRINEYNRKKGYYIGQY